MQFLKIVTRVVGTEVLKDTAEFAANFEGMYDGFKERAQAVYELLRQPATAFVVVTTPHEQAVEEALFFATTLNRHRLPFGGLVVNRIHPHFEIDLADAGEATGSPVLDRLVQLAGEYEQGRKREDRSLRRLEWEVPQERWARIPYLSGEVTDLPSLVGVGAFMFV